jgi:hypothetical protein
MQKDRLTLKRAREERREAVREYIGRHWSEEGTPHSVPLNLISLYCRIVGPKLISNHPKVQLSTMRKQHKPVVSAMEDWANEEIETINLKSTLQRNAIDALFSIGIAKVAIATPADSATKNWNQRAGQPFAERVDLDDFVYDTHARDFDEAGYIGHRFRVPLDVVRESKIYGPGRKELTASEDKLFNLEGDERISMLGREYYSNQEEYEDFVDLWEIYLPRHRVVVTLADDYLTGASESSAGKYTAKALREVNWIGPDRGPYHILAYGIVPGNSMPKSPIQDLIDLHSPTNNILRKQIAQAQRQKSNLLYSGAATEDAQRVTTANDGDAIRVDNPQSVAEVARGGPDPKNFTLMMQLKELFSWASGNLDIMGGLSPQSRTAHQDEMLNQNSSGTVADLQQKTVEYTSDIIESLCWFWHHHPTNTMESEYSAPGGNASITRKVTPQHRAAVPFKDLNVQVDPYTLQHQTPQQKMQALDAVVAQLMPMMQLLQQQGIMFDVNVYLQKKAEYLNMPDLAEMFTVRPPPQDAGAGQGGGESPGMPAKTERTYTRRSLGGDSQQATGEGLMQSMESAMGSGNGKPSNGAVK